MIKQVRVSDFAEVITGGTPSTTVGEYWAGGTIPWLNSGELNKKYIYDAKNFITEAGLKSSSSRLMPAETVLIALTGATCGLSALTKIEACANQSVTGILPSEKHSPGYLLHYLRTQREKILNKAWGNAQPHISQKFVKDLLIPLLPLPEQLHIANLLSKTENLIAQRKESIALLDEFLKSTFLDMFGDPVRNENKWELMSISQLADVLTGFAFKSEMYSNNLNDIKICGGLIVYPDFIDWEKANYWSLKDEQKLERYLLNSGDIVMALDRPWITSGFKIAMIKQEDPRAILIQRTARIRCSRANKDYIYFLFKHRIFEIHCKPTQTTVPHISPKEIQNFRIPVPPIELQTQFAQIVEKTEALKEQYKNSLKELENLYGSLSQRAFRGELFN